MRRNREERGREATLCLYVDNGRTVPVQRCGSQALSELYHAMWDTDFEVQTPANICWPGRPEIQRLKANITLSIIWGEIQRSTSVSQLEHHEAREYFRVRGNAHDRVRVRRRTVLFEVVAAAVAA